MVGRKPGETERGIESIDLEARCNICWEHEIYQNGKHWQGPRCCLVPWGLEQGRLPLESLQHCFGQMGWGYHAKVRKSLIESPEHYKVRVGEWILTTTKSSFHRLECGREEKKCCEVILVTSQVVWIKWVLNDLVSNKSHDSIFGLIGVVPGPSSGLPSILHGSIRRRAWLQWAPPLHSYWKVIYILLIFAP